MNFNDYLVILSALYATYYLFNIAYDTYKSKSIPQENDNKTTIKMEESEIIFDDDFTPQDVTSTYLHKPFSGVNVEDEKKDMDPEYEIENDLTQEENSKKIANVTNHGGYTTATLKELFAGISQGNENPFKSVIAQME